MEGRLSSLSKRREMDAISGPELDNKIDAIRSQLDKGLLLFDLLEYIKFVCFLEVHDATLLIQQKHVEFLPQTMFLNVQFSIEQTITKAESALKELAHVAEDVDRQLGDIVSYFDSLFWNAYCSMFFYNPCRFPLTNTYTDSE